MENTRWASEYLLSHGYVITQVPEQIQATPWSTVTRFSTTNGYIYLKQTPLDLSLEAPIMQILRNHFHKNVPTIIAINVDLNCFLMKNGGNPLRDYLKEKFDPDLFSQAIKKYTDIQCAVENDIKTFLELGIPDWRLNNFPALYDELLCHANFLNHDGLTNEDLQSLYESREKLITLCEKIAAYKIRETIDHCDFHDNNILIKNNSRNITIIDWGETVITHPFFSLSSCLHKSSIRYTFSESDKTYIQLREACLENWKGVLSQDNLLNVFQLINQLRPVYLALGFYRLIVSSHAEILKSSAGRLSGYLKVFIKT
jgi:hypothetical protein